MYPGTYAETQPDKPAVIHPASGTVLSYRELDQRSNQLAHLLYDHGLRAGDHLALFLENHPAYLEIVWACLRCGLYLTPINRHLSVTEAAYIVDDCDASVLIASSALEQSSRLGELSSRCTLKLSVGGEVQGFTDYRTATAGMPTHNGPSQGDQKTPTLIHACTR
jgi:long-chain acyl-CoA synthetase